MAHHFPSPTFISNFYSTPLYCVYYPLGVNVTDQYLADTKASKKSKKHRKKHKKGKRGRTHSASSDDIPVAHTVDIVGEEMPEVG